MEPEKQKVSSSWNLDWLKPFLPLLQAALSAYLSGRIIKRTAADAKNIAVRSGIVGFGSLSLLAFLVAAVIMTFVDLGGQFESRNEIHFSGMMLSSIYLACLGGAVFGICYVVASFVAKKSPDPKEVETPAGQPYAHLITLGEELLKQMIEKQKNPAAKSDEVFPNTKS